MSLVLPLNQALYVNTQTTVDFPSICIIDAIDENTHAISGRLISMPRSFTNGLLMQPGGLAWGNTTLPKEGDLAMVLISPPSQPLVTPVSSHYGPLVREGNTEQIENQGFRKLRQGEIHSHSIGQSQVFYDESGNLQLFDSAGSGLSFITAEGTIREEAINAIEKFASGVSLLVGAIRRQVSGAGQFLEGADDKSTPTAWDLKLILTQDIGVESLHLREQLGDITDASDNITDLVKKFELNDATGNLFSETLDRSAALLIEGGRYQYLQKDTGSLIEVSDAGDVIMDASGSSVTIEQSSGDLSMTHFSGSSVDVKANSVEIVTGANSIVTDLSTGQVRLVAGTNTVVLNSLTGQIELVSPKILLSGATVLLSNVSELLQVPLLRQEFITLFYNVAIDLLRRHTHPVTVAGTGNLGAPVISAGTAALSAELNIPPGLSFAPIIPPAVTGQVRGA